MKSFIEKAMKIYRNQKGFTLIELLVVMAILAIIVGLVVPNFFGITGEAFGTQIMGQHEKMREAVYLYYTDTAEWPTEWSEGTLLSGAANIGDHQLWADSDDAGIGLTVAGWDGTYVDRPILQDNPWGGHWGVWEGVLVDTDAAGPAPILSFNSLVYYNVPLAIAQQVDAVMDDGDLGTGSGYDTGAVQYDEDGLVGTGPTFGGVTHAPGAANMLVIIIAEQP